MAMLRLATFNVLHGILLADASTNPLRLKAAVREIGADVLAMQEVDRSQPRSALADQTVLAAAAMGARWRRFVPTVLGTPGVRGWRPATDASDPDELSDAPLSGIALLS